MGRRKLVSDEAILEAMKTKQPLKKIATQLSVSYWTVLARLKKLGISTRTKRFLNAEKFSSYSKELCYWAGFLAADGWVTLYQVGVELSAKDSAHLEKLRSFAESNADITYRSKSMNGKTYKMAYLLFSSRVLTQHLVDLFNITPAKSLTLQPPLQMPREFRSHFIRGYFDGDGCINWHKHNDKPRVSFISGSKVFLEWIQNTMNEEAGEIGSPLILKRANSNAHDLSFSGLQVKRIHEWMYREADESTWLDRKRARFQEFIARAEKIMESSRLARSEHVAALEGLYADGMSYKEIAEHLGLTKEAVAYYLRSSPISKRFGKNSGMAGQKRLERDKEILFMYERGIPMEEISARFGLEKSTCYKAMRRAKQLENHVRIPPERQHPVCRSPARTFDPDRHQGWKDGRGRGTGADHQPTARHCPA